MAARLNRMHSDKVVERIQVSNLVTRLQKHALRQLKNPNDKSDITMSPSEVDAAKFLIERKLARAVAPQDLNVKGSMTVVIQAAKHDDNL